MKKTQQVILSYWKRNKWFCIAMIVTLVAAAFLRLYKLEEFITFLGDQGRDAIVMKRLATFEDFPGIGPRSSIGEVFLGPFYYYLMAPFLVAFNFSPVGPAFGVVLISLIALVYILIRLQKDMGTKEAVIFGLLVAFSYVCIWLNRFSWNPNLLPVFSYLTIYFCYRLSKNPTPFFGTLFGFFLAGALQLHYLMMLVGPALLGCIGYSLWFHRKKLKKTVVSLTFAAVSFGITFAPFIVFDIKNNFLNVKGLFGIFGQDQFTSESTYFDRLLGVLNNFLQNIFQVQVQGQIGWLLLMALLVLFALLAFHRIKSKSISLLIIYHVGTILSFILLFAVVDTQRNMHYYTPVYYSFFIVVAYVLGLIKQKHLFYTATAIFMTAYIMLNAQAYWFFKGLGNFQTRIAESIADSILSMDIAAPYYLVSVPLASTNDHIRYYLELKGMRPLAQESMEEAENLVILCYEKGEKACNVLDEPQYQVVVFGDRRIVKEINHKEGVRIFKLIHAK